MSLNRYVRQLNPIKKSKVDYVQKVSEAYDIFPKSEGEIDTLDIKHDKEKLKDLFKDVIAKSGGMPDPIALQSTSKDVKISSLLEIKWQ